MAEAPVLEPAPEPEVEARAAAEPQAADADSTWRPALPDSNYPVTGYERRFGLDIVQGGVAFDPDFGGGGGGQLAFSDLLGNEQLYVTIANEGSGGGRSFLQAFDVGLTYMNQSRRLNWGVGAFRLSRTYNADLDVFRYETRLGGMFLASYPLTRFNRIETSLVVRHISDHLYRAGVIQDTWFISNLFSYIHDTTLWNMAGSFDGTRYNLTVGLTTDIGAGIGDYTSILADYRRYQRLPGGVIYAFRGSTRLSFGEEGQRHFAGGAHTLRGYGRRSVYGTRLTMMNHEVRFPLIDRLVMRMPMGPFDLPVFYGSVFFDAAWTGDPEWARRPLGAVGAGIYVGGGPYPRFRFDFARVTDFHTMAPHWDTEFSIGFNY
jgi:outer membrane protein assembly factor BamA